jgi:hypothetical protein
MRTATAGHPKVSPSATNAAIQMSVFPFAKAEAVRGQARHIVTRRIPRLAGRHRNSDQATLSLREPHTKGFPEVA